MEDLQERIALILSTKGLSNAQFAERIGVQPSSISHLMSGRNKPSLDVVTKILRRFPEIQNDWLLFGKGAMTKDFNLDLFGIDNDTKSDQVEIKPENKPVGSGPPAVERPVFKPKELKKEQKETLSFEKQKDTPSESGHKKNPIQDKNQEWEKTVDKIVIFYTDHTFRVYHPEN